MNSTQVKHTADQCSPSNEFYSQNTIKGNNVQPDTSPKNVPPSLCAPRIHLSPHAKRRRRNAYTHTPMYSPPSQPPPVTVKTLPHFLHAAALTLSHKHLHTHRCRNPNTIGFPSETQSALTPPTSLKPPINTRICPPPCWHRRRTGRRFSTPATAFTNNDCYFANGLR